MPARPLFCAALWAIAVTAHAAPPPDATIVVTGQKIDRAAVHHQIVAFLRSATVVPEAGQYARRNAGYCPKIIGVDHAIAARVTDRIIAVGRAAGLADPRPGCAPDLTIVFTGDADGLMTLMQKRRPRLLEQVDSRKAEELFGSGRPVRWWYASGRSPAGGGSVGNSSAAGPTGTEAGLNGMAQGNAVSVYSASLIETSIKVDLDGTYVIVDVNKATGFPLDSIASFAGMVSFAQIDGRREFSGFPSILAMFAEDTDKATVPTTLTEWDKAYLRGMYRIAANRDVRIQRTRLAGEMMRAIAP